jgi:pyridoxal 5'-phosphate synthase pdxT subunit
LVNPAGDPGAADKPRPAGDGPVIGVLALQGAVVAHQRMLEALGVRAPAVRTVADLDVVDGLVVPGGESTTMWHLLRTSGLESPLRERLDAGLPALGTCAGMILLAAKVLDGRPDQGVLGVIDVAVRRNAFGRQVASFETDLDVPALADAGLAADPFHAVFIRAPVVEGVGQGVEILATVDDQPVAVRQGPVIATAFHPELADDDRVHRLFVGLVASDHVAPR